MIEYDPFTYKRIVDFLCDGKFAQTHEQLYKKNWIACLNHWAFLIVRAKEIKEELKS